MLLIINKLKAAGFWFFNFYYKGSFEVYLQIKINAPNKNHIRDLKADYPSGFSEEKLLLLTLHSSCLHRTRADLSGLCIGS